MCRRPAIVTPAGRRDVHDARCNTFRLPAAYAADACVSEAGLDMATVLVVDDVAENRDLVTVLLRGHGHETLEANSGLAALDVLARRPADLVLSDVTMPGMDGYQLARHIRSDPATRQIPVIFYTANYLA